MSTSTSAYTSASSSRPISRKSSRPWRIPPSATARIHLAALPQLDELDHVVLVQLRVRRGGREDDGQYGEPAALELGLAERDDEPPRALHPADAAQERLPALGLVPQLRGEVNVDELDRG